MWGVKLLKVALMFWIDVSSLGTRIKQIFFWFLKFLSRTKSLIFAWSAYAMLFKSWWLRCWSIVWNYFWMILFQILNWRFWLVDLWSLAISVYIFLLKKQKGLKLFVTIKLDMSKAYDWVEWTFLQGIMFVLGFQSFWVDLIMECITTSSLSILLNGVPSQVFTPTRGICQGNPLFLFLFLFFMEGLSLLLQLALGWGTLLGMAPLSFFFSFKW